jgi:hypothetical protein
MEKLNDLEKEVEAPEHIKRNVSANLDFYRLMGDTTTLYVRDFFSVFIDLLGFFQTNENEEKDDLNSKNDI